MAQNRCFSNLKKRFHALIIYKKTLTKIWIKILPDDITKAFSHKSDHNKTYHNIKIYLEYQNIATNFKALKALNPINIC